VSPRRLPREVFSIFGNYRLTRDPGECPNDAFGIFRPNKRVVAIHEKTAPELVWSTYWHEATHVALFDSGCMNGLTEKQQEAVCDAMGLYLSKMMDAGMLKVVSPRSPKQSKEK